MKYIVEGGQSRLLSSDDEIIQYPDSYGWDWIVVEASSPEDALEQAEQWDHNEHPAQTEMQLFAVLARNTEPEDLYRMLV